MKKYGHQHVRSSESLLVEIITILEAHGIDQDTYTLQEYVDPDALAELVTSEDADLEVCLTIEGVQLSIAQDRVSVLEQPSSNCN